MDWTKHAKIISNAVFSVGAFISLCLLAIVIFGSNEVINPEAKLTFTWKEQAFIFLAFGTIPMLLACMAVYKFNNVKNSIHKKKNFVFIFLPAFICSACALYIIGVIFLGYINSMF